MNILIFPKKYQDAPWDWIIYLHEERSKKGEIFKEKWRRLVYIYIIYTTIPWSRAKVEDFSASDALVFERCYVFPGTVRCSAGDSMSCHGDVYNGMWIHSAMCHFATEGPPFSWCEKGSSLNSPPIISTKNEGV